MKNIFNFKLAKNEFNLLKTILFLIMIVYIFIIILAYTSYDSHGRNYMNANTDYIIFTQLAYYTSIFIVSIYSFRYMYNRKALDMYHSFPIKKTTIMLTKLITGYVLISILFTIASYAICSLSDLSRNDILKLVSLSLLSGLFEYSCFMLVATICNGIFFHIVLTASILFIPVLMSLIVSIFNQTYTFIHSTYPFGLVPEKIFDTFFIERYYNYNDSFRIYMYQNNIKTVMSVAILTVLIIGLSIYSYNLRKSENLSSYIIFKPIRIFFQSCITFIITILIVRIFMSEISIMLIYMMCIILCILLTFIIDSILNFKINNIKYSMPYYITSLLSVLIFINVYDNNLYGMFNTPSLSNIQSATIRNEDIWYDETEVVMVANNDTNSTALPYNNSALINLQNPEIINKLVQLQDSQFEQFRKDEYAFMGNTNVTVSYKLNNGRIALRTFTLDEVDYADTINDIQSNSSNKQDIIHMLSNASEYDTSISLDVFTLDNSSTQQTDEFLNALIEDIKNDNTFRTVSYQSPIIGKVIVYTRNGSSYSIDTPINIKLDYTNTLQLLGIDATSFDVLAVPEQDIQGNDDELSNIYLEKTTDVLRTKVEDLPNSYYDSEFGSVKVDYLIDTLQLNNYKYLTGDDTSLYWDSQEYIADWLPYPTGLNFHNNLIKVDDSQYYRTFIVIDDTVLLNSEQLVIPK